MDDINLRGDNETIGKEDDDFFQISRDINDIFETKGIKLYLGQILG